jgi:hypothetical protein
MCSSGVEPVLYAALGDCILCNVPCALHHTGTTSPILPEWNVKLSAPLVLGLPMHHGTVDNVLILR